LYDALFNVGYHVVFSYWVMYYGEKMLSDIWTVHIIAYKI